MSEPEQDEQPTAVMPQSGPDRDEMASEYLPEQDDWLAKTVLDLNDPHAVAAIRQFSAMYPEVDELDEMVDGFTQDFLKGRTSISGESRKEYRSIIESLFGGSVDEGAQQIATLLGADGED